MISLNIIYIIITIVLDIAGIGFGFVLCCMDDYKYNSLKEKALIIFGIVFVLCLFCVCGLAVADSHTEITTYEFESSNSIEIVSCDDKGQIINGFITGGIFYTRGYIESVPVYICYAKLDEHRYIQKSIPIQDTIIITNNNNESKIIEESFIPIKIILGFIEKRLDNKINYKLCIPEENLYQNISLGVV